MGNKLKQSGLNKGPGWFHVTTGSFSQDRQMDSRDASSHLSKYYIKETIVEQSLEHKKPGQQKKKTFTLPTLYQGNYIFFFFKFFLKGIKLIIVEHSPEYNQDLL